MRHDSCGFAKSQGSIHVSTLNMLPETCKVSCQDGLGLADLVDVATAQRCTSMSVAPSWDLAFVFLNALRDRKGPLKAARDHLNLSPSGPAHCENEPSGLYISNQALTGQWNEIPR